ncbi:CS1 type fimbrial major subunit [Pseudomonas sp. NFACC46-3]|uniref:CS1 type fimbrial major subunit n=1 Tax=Pseudomonas sp. NFACC46-3 TaxID=1566200 RepID=UPI0008E31995|nr:CS1 type fimbrial major subunit [Pseudomonas sp. NFACC46-3]SFL99503.1 CS1 type fimbrial major subunit [Pseudomonas sp. NFACC46-3]
MFKKIVSFTALVVAALSPSWVLAADDARAAIHITANIPNKQFYVMPRDPEFGKNEVMHYNPVTSALSPVRQLFDVKNTDGSVHAYIDRRPDLFNGRNSIPIAVVFNNVYLNHLPKEVVDDVTSTPGTTVELHISTAFPINPQEQTGLYTGQFTVVFDAVPRVSL